MKNRAEALTDATVAQSTDPRQRKCPVWAVSPHDHTGRHYEALAARLGSGAHSPTRSSGPAGAGPDLRSRPEPRGSRRGRRSQVVLTYAHPSPEDPAGRHPAGPQDEPVAVREATGARDARWFASRDPERARPRPAPLPAGGVRPLCRDLASAPGARTYGTQPQVLGCEPSCLHRWARHTVPAGNRQVSRGKVAETLNCAPTTRYPRQPCSAPRAVSGTANRVWNRTPGSTSSLSRRPSTLSGASSVPSGPSGCISETPTARTPRA